MTKLHLGCGKRYLKGWTHIDLVTYPHIDHVIGINNLDIYQNNSVDGIYACHCLEHFKRGEVLNVLCEWFRVLKEGGEIHISVPDFEAMTNEYHSNGRILEPIMGLLYGRQDYEYNIHYHTFDFKLMEKLLTKAGFCNIGRYEWQDFLPEGFDDFSRAYLPHMDFNKGRLMSLNITAIKPGV